MQIQLREGAVWTCVEALRQSTAAGAEEEKREAGVKGERSKRRDDRFFERQGHVTRAISATSSHSRAIFLSFEI
jgi:hypothetical protein